MIDKFYSDFHIRVEKTLKESEKTTGERILGIDPESGEDVLVKVGRYGPLAQLGKVREDYKPRFASLRKDQRIETISLEEALDLFKLPREIGDFEKNSMIVAISKYGPYIRHDGKFYSLEKQDDPLSINSERAIEIIRIKREEDSKKVIKIFSENETLRILNGRWGPYISYEKKNYKIPKNNNPEELSLEDCLNIIANSKKKKSTKRKS